MLSPLTHSSSALSLPFPFLLPHVTHDFAISSLIPISPLKHTSCINFHSIPLPYSSLSSSHTGCSWFNLRLDVTSGPHAVSSPFSILSLFRVSFSYIREASFSQCIQSERRPHGLWLLWVELDLFSPSPLCLRGRHLTVALQSRAARSLGWCLTSTRSQTPPHPSKRKTQHTHIVSSVMLCLCCIAQNALIWRFSHTLGPVLIIKKLLATTFASINS